MGSFSFTKADRLTKIANILEDKPFKLLIPLRFGGGFIKDRYQGYGRIGIKEDGSPRYDMYELLAFWNASGQNRERLLYDGEFPMLKEIDDTTGRNRSIGIDMGCYDGQVDRLEFPLKLVSASYKGTYEDCPGRSYSDPNQGWDKLSWDEFDRIIATRRLRRMETEKL